MIKKIQKLINPQPNTEGSKSIKKLILNDEIKKKKKGNRKESSRARIYFIFFVRG